MMTRPLTRGVGNDLRSHIPAARGFTLVELLVVISIIALLISILLPSLKAAREQAKTLKCQANLAGISKASATYQSEENEWIPGSPGTTGTMLLPRYNTNAGDYDPIPEHPLQIWDYAGPLAGTQMAMKSLPRLRSERWPIMIRNIFACPSNKFLSTPNLGAAPYTGTVFKPQAMVSYNTVRNFLFWGSGTRAPNAAANPIGVIGGTTEWAPGYVPRANLVGQPSEKIFISDGSRYIAPEGILDHDISWNGGAGGAFSDGGATLPDLYLRSFIRSNGTKNPQFSKYSYRHARGNVLGLAVGFFDGHAERLTEIQSRLPDYWWPKGTVLPTAELNIDSHKAIFTALQGGKYRVRR